MADAVGFRIPATARRACKGDTFDAHDSGMPSASGLAAALAAACITPQQHLVAAYVLQHTLNAGRATMAPPVATLATACRLDEREARWALRRLATRQILVVHRNGAGLPPTVSINPDTAAWRTSDRS